MHYTSSLEAVPQVANIFADASNDRAKATSPWPEERRKKDQTRQRKRDNENFPGREEGAATRAIERLNWFLAGSIKHRGSNFELCSPHNALNEFERAVWLALHYYAGPDDTCYPSKLTIAKRAGRNPSNKKQERDAEDAVRKVIRFFELAKLITVVKTSGGLGYSNTYKLNVPTNETPVVATGVNEFDFERYRKIKPPSSVRRNPRCERGQTPVVETAKPPSSERGKQLSEQLSKTTNKHLVRNSDDLRTLQCDASHGEESAELASDTMATVRADLKIIGMPDRWIKQACAHHDGNPTRAHHIINSKIKRAAAQSPELRIWEVFYALINSTVYQAVPQTKTTERVSAKYAVNVSFSDDQILEAVQNERMRRAS